MSFKLEELANNYAERVCSGEFPIEYTRQQVVGHTKSDFIAGVKEYQQHVISVIQENAEACKDLVIEDRIRPAQDIVNETYEDLLFIFRIPD